MNTTTPSLIDEVPALLSDGVARVFDTMLSLPATPAAVRDLHQPGQSLVAGSVGFIGDVNGIVYIHVTAPFARSLAGRMLGMAETDLGGDEMVNDVVGELTNMIVGSVKSRLCDSGLSCVLTIPSIVRGQNFSFEPVGSSERRVLGFCCGDDTILAELFIKLPG
ncbi:MAG TPA: chemotaxis protein CheX [Dongiaceae bacterium]|nr:chemotaxis protein CheX [Dongiaceae bacterium]